MAVGPRPAQAPAPPPAAPVRTAPRQLAPPGAEPRSEGRGLAFSPRPGTAPRDSTGAGTTAPSVPPAHLSAPKRGRCGRRPAVGVLLGPYCTMTPASADSSEGSERWCTELSQSYCSSGLDYSEDTFESFSEEEEDCWQEESKPSASCSTEDLEGSAVSDTLEGHNRAEMTELLDGELDALRAFCALKISNMCQQLISERAEGGKARRLQHGFTAKKPQTSGSNFIIPDQLMNRIHLENIRETVKQVTEVEIHRPSVCPDCQKKEAELAKVAFLRRKKVLMESALIQDKLEEQIYFRDVITLLGEAVRDLPKPSEDPKSLWQRLKCLKM